MALSDSQNSTRSTPNIPTTKATLHIGSSTFIAAPSHRVWATLTDTSTWPNWNSFVPRVTIRSQPKTSTEETEGNSLSPILQPGTKVTFHVRMDPTSTKAQAARDVHLVVTECVKPSVVNNTVGTIVWISDFEVPGAMGPSLLTAERVHELTDAISEGVSGTEVRNWEAQVGWLVYIVKALFGTKLQVNFEHWVNDLKGFVEAGN
ncbi:hypothetical protein N7495_009451 [Penicillium taxi]|uniref:uncharacterized protein n=1 Tax=Penicillium taxi TaxID=168475 RepID=UPI002544E920|nr:uncharacterized protein N7495_009451 [Penicillium taxi]KAJ5884941.1 hypothetical protein N7495_009451 [Penicillium taxi]